MFIEALGNLKRMGENLNFTSDIFYGREDEDPVEWLKDFNYAAEANNWSKERRLKIVPNYLRGQARSWFKDKMEDIEEWNKETIKTEENEEGMSFEEAFIKKFTSKERRRIWKKQLYDLQQKEASVSNYTTKFNKLIDRIS